MYMDMTNAVFYTEGQTWVLRKTKEMNRTKEDFAGSSTAAADLTL